MTESTKPQSSGPRIPDDFYWVTYLREDIQDLRQDQRHSMQVMHGQFQEFRQEMRGEVQESRQEMRGEVQQVRDDIRRLDTRIDETNRRIDSRFAILMTTLIGVAGVIIAAIKL